MRGWGLCVLGLLQQCFDASAWGEAGHERINRMAQNLLHGKHRDQIRTLMHADVVDVSAWERTLTARFPETSVLHWHHQNPEWTCNQRDAEKTDHIRCDGHGAEQGSLFCGLAFFFQHFADEMLLQEYPAPKVPIDTPKKLDVLNKVGTDELYDGRAEKRKNMEAAHYLRWLTTLVGDLHQPLHWLREKEYGSEVKIRYKDEEYTLLSFWEDFLPKHLPEQPSVSELDLEYKLQYHDWGHRLPPELFREWAGEMSAKVCGEIYGPLYTNHADGSRSIENPFSLSEELFAKWSALAAQLTQEGGERLALVYLDILEHKRHKAAEKEGRGLLPPLLPASPAGPVSKTAPSGQGRSGNSIPAPVAGDKDSSSRGSSASAQLKLLHGLHRARRRRAWRNLGINTMIAILVVPTLLIGLNLHSKSRGGIKLSNAFSKKDNS